MFVLVGGKRQLNFEAKLRNGRSSPLTTNMYQHYEVELTEIDKSLSENLPRKPINTDSKWKTVFPSIIIAKQHVGGSGDLFVATCEFL